MKKILIAFLLTVCLLAIYFTIRAGSTAWGIGIDLLSSQVTVSTYTFTADPVPDNSPYGYSYFWFFDDGSFDITEDSIISHPFQAFQGSNTNQGRQVHVEVTKLYEKGDKPIAVSNNSQIN
ncbi:MAG: hypothetical protein IPH04_12190 [Saprospirales bacterium]|nr:hypothetical protein [Saprospirales bacterium]